MPAEDIPMRDPILGQRIHQCHGHMVLSRNICETLWPVFSCKNLICHKENQRENEKREPRSQSIPAAGQPAAPIVSPTDRPQRLAAWFSLFIFSLIFFMAYQVLARKY